MDLTDIKGLGPAKADKLRAAGIDSVEALASMDLRRIGDVGVSTEILKRFKKDARKLLDDAGIPYAKAPYGDAPRSTPEKTTATAAPEPGHNGHDGARKKGFFARLFKRS